MKNIEAIERIKIFGLHHAIKDLPYSTKTVEAFDMAICALENADQYQWHDLRENPDDLPERDGTYWVHVIGSSGNHVEGECDYSCKYRCFETSQDYELIAWKDVEPFEED